MVFENKTQNVPYIFKNSDLYIKCTIESSGIVMKHNVIEEWEIGGKYR